MLCELECSACGAIFRVYPLQANAFDGLRYCEECLVVKNLIDSAEPPQPLAYHGYQWNWGYALRRPLRAPRAYWIWWRYLRHSYGVEVEENTVKLFPLAHIVLTDADVTQ